MKLIYVLGEGRSGSTLLERILGQHSEIFAAGELKHIWGRSFKENQLCSCGETFEECDVWNKIVKEGRLEEVDFNWQIMAQEETVRLRHYWKIKKYLDVCFDDLDPMLKDVLNAYYNLYKSIISVTGKKYVLDASKHPVFAIALSMHPNIDLSIIHLVRDVRGVTYSWRKKKLRPEITSRNEFMPRYPLFRSVLSWIVVNAIGDKLNDCVENYMCIRYEDIVGDAKSSVTNIFDKLGVNDETNLFFEGDSRVVLNKNHTVAGNPMRFKTGVIDIKLDEGWKNKIGVFSKIAISILACSAIKKYGYKIVV